MKESLRKRPDRLSREIQEHLRVPGADLKSLRVYLMERENLSFLEAEELAGAVAERLDREKFPPITEMELMLTEECDQRCDYCFVEGKNNHYRMDGETARRAVEFLFCHSRKRPRLKILFFGGEPLLEYDRLREVVEDAEARAAETGQSVIFNMTTNASLLDRERCEYLAAHRVKYLVSIDGPREVHDRHRKRPDGKSSYGLIAENIPLMKKYQPWLGARITVHPDTAGELPESFSHLVELGFSQFLIGPATGIEWTGRDLDLYRDSMIEIARRLKAAIDRGRKLRVNALEESLKMRAGKKLYRGCRAGRQSVTVTGEGEIYPCSKMLGVMGREGLNPLGSLAEGITAIHDRLRYCGLIPTASSACESCRWEDICTGGCFAVNWQETGEIFRPSPSECRFQERIVEIMKAAEPILGEEYFRAAVKNLQRKLS
ncbi:MAG: radical SAM protein [Candidatus Erginobacter occultus]|nr:radical SAM protein [Candidatus Erginobacter occultus]